MEPWWLGRRIHCAKCGGVWMLERGDAVTTLAESAHRGMDNEVVNTPRHAELVCPTDGCHSIIWLYP